MFLKRKVALTRFKGVIRPRLRNVLWIILLLVFAYGYSVIKSGQYDGGKYSVDSGEIRDLAHFRIKPWQVEQTIKSGTCGITPDTMKWGMTSLVKSAVTNRERRDVIRSTWGNICALDDIILRVVFVVGVVDDVTAMQSLKEENERFGDILLYEKPDLPRFVPHKILAGMQWATEILPQHWFYASADDDILVHVPHLVDYITTLLGSSGPMEQAPLSCIYSFQEHDAPARDPTSKWFVSHSDYPGWYWPQYCRGGFYIMPSSMNSRIFNVSRTTSLLHLDDVWITGFMRRRLGEGDVNIVAAPESKKSNDREFMKEQNPETVLVQHMWGNVEGVKVDVPDKLINVWQSWQSGFEKSRKFCTLNSLWLKKAL